MNRTILFSLLVLILAAPLQAMDYEMLEKEHQETMKAKIGKKRKKSHQRSNVVLEGRISKPTKRAILKTAPRKKGGNISTQHRVFKVLRVLQQDKVREPQKEGYISRRAQRKELITRLRTKDTQATTVIPKN
jgi:hypothetical protein